MHKRTIIDRIEIDPQTGVIGLRMRKQIVDDDGVTVIASEYHRTTIAAETDPASQIAVVNAHLGTMGFPAVRAEDVATLNGVLPSLASLRAQKAQEARDAAANR